MKGLARVLAGRSLSLGLAIVMLTLLPSLAAAQGPLVNGQNHTGSISAPAETDQWTFSANAGDYIVVSVGEVGADSPFVPWIRLLAPPAGTLVAQDWGPLAAQLAWKATVSGTYSVLVASNDSARSQQGNYVLTLAKIPGPFVVPSGDQGGPMTNGANHQGVIGRGDLDMWTFVANEGDSLLVSIGEVGGDSPFVPWIRLFDPNGEFLNQDWGPLAAQVGRTAPSTGVYTVLVGTNDSGRAATGTYVLTLAKISGAFVVPVGDEGGPMANAVVNQGVILTGDLDQWTFMAAPRSLVVIGAAEVGGDTPFVPWIRLYSPSGTLVTQDWGATSASISTTLQVGGLYTVVVGTNDSARDASGFYTITATGIIPQGSINSSGDVVVDFGPPYGLWLDSNQTSGRPQWLQLNGQSPTRIARGDVDGNGTVDLIANFKGRGVWIWKIYTGWAQLHAFDATDIVTGDLDGNGKDEVILSFPNIGLWVHYNDSTWQQLHALSPSAMATGNLDNDQGGKSELIVTFPNNGVWAYMNNASWEKVHGLSADQIQTGDFDGDGQDDLVLNFPGQGLWVRSNNTSWSQIHPYNAAGMTVGNIDGDASRRKDIVINFPGYGVYAWLNGSTWTQLHYLNSPLLATADLDNSGKDDVIMNFSGYGVWLYRNNAGYEQLHPFDVKAIAAGRFDLN